MIILITRSIAVMSAGKISFIGRTAIITGAGGGLGRHYALELAKRGCNIVVNDLGGNLTGGQQGENAAKSVVGIVIF